MVADMKMLKTQYLTRKGDLEAFIVKNAEFSENYFTFSKDKKTMYCLVQNVLDYNKWDSKTGVITPKKARQVITSLSIVTYNLENKTVKYEDFKNENWGVKFSNQILMDNDDQLLLLGTNITKKAKEAKSYSLLSKNKIKKGANCSLLLFYSLSISFNSGTKLIILEMINAINIVPTKP
jgi:hypothetical protein